MTRLVSQEWGRTQGRASEVNEILARLAHQGNQLSARLRTGKYAATKPKTVSESVRYKRVAVARSQQLVASSFSPPIFRIPISPTQKCKLPATQFACAATTYNDLLPPTPLTSNSQFENPLPPNRHSPKSLSQIVIPSATRNLLSAGDTSHPVPHSIALFAIEFRLPLTLDTELSKFSASAPTPSSSHLPRSSAPATLPAQTSPRATALPSRRLPAVPAP